MRTNVFQINTKSYEKNIFLILYYIQNDGFCCKPEERFSHLNKFTFNTNI